MEPFFGLFPLFLWLYEKWLRRCNFCEARILATFYNALCLRFIKTQKLQPFAKFLNYVLLLNCCKIFFPNSINNFIMNYNFFSSP